VTNESTARPSTATAAGQNMTFPVPPADPGALRDRIASAVDAVFERWSAGLGGQRPQDAVTDAVLAELPAPVDRAAVRAEAFEDAAAMLAGLDPVKAALAGQHAWNDAAGLVRHMATQERRMADEAQPGTGCPQCGDSGACNGGPCPLHPAVEAQPTQPQQDELRCVCGDPVQLMDDNDPTSWIHSPGSHTRCLHARPRCPHCQMPHAMTPQMFLMCASIRASIRDRDAAEAQQDGAPRSAPWGVCPDCRAAAGPDCDCPPFAEQDGAPS
jgi:hypothetical protein